MRGAAENMRGTADNVPPSLRRELQHLEKEFKGQAAAMRVMMETLEDTMPIGDTHALLKQERSRTTKELETYMEEVAVEMSDLEDRAQAACLQSVSHACDELALRCRSDIESLQGHVASAPWSPAVVQLEELVMSRLATFEQQQRQATTEFTDAERAVAARLEEHQARLTQIEQSHERAAEAVQTLAARLDAALAEVEGSLKSAAAEAERTAARTSEQVERTMAQAAAQVERTMAQAAAQAERASAQAAEQANRAAAQAAVERDNIRSEGAEAREEARVNVSRLHDSLSEVHKKMDEVAEQLAGRLEAHTASTSRDVVGVSQQLDTKLQRLGDNFADELQRLITTQEELATKQNEERSLNLSSAEQFSAQIGSLRKDAEATQLRITDMETASHQNIENLDRMIHTKVDGVDGRLEQLVRDFETGLSGLRVAVDLIQNEAAEGNHRIDGISAALSDLGQDIATCGRDVGQSARDNARCQQQIQELSSQVEERILNLGSQVEGLGTQLQSLDADAASQLTQQSAQIDELGSQAEQWHGELENKLYSLEAAHEAHVKASGRTCEELAGRVTANGQAMTLAQEEWFGACTVLENQQNDIKAASLLRVEQAEESFRIKLADAQANSQDVLVARLQEQSARIDDLNAQMKSSNDNNAAQEQHIARALADQAARVDRHEVDAVARLDSAREEFEQRFVQQSKLEGEARAQLERAILAVRQKDTERDAHSMKTASEINAHEIRMDKLERNLQEWSEHQKADLQRLQDDAQDSIVKLSELHQQDLTSHSQTQKQLMKELERTVISRVEEMSTKTEAKSVELHSMNDTKLLALAEDLRQMKAEIAADIRSQASQDIARAKSLVEAAVESNTKTIRAEILSMASELTRKFQESASEREKPLLRDIRELQNMSKDLERKVMEDATHHSTQLNNLESSLEKLVEDTCSALDEHWSARLSEQTQRIADFESAAAKGAESSSATIRQQFDSLDTKLKKQLVETAQVSAGHVAELEARFTAANDQVAASMSQLRKQEAEKEAAHNAQFVELNVKLQSALSDSEMALREQITRAHAEHFAQLDELETKHSKRATEQAAQQENTVKSIYGLRNETDTLRSATLQQIEEQRKSIESVATTLDKVAQKMDDQITTLYSDVSNTVNSAQLTVEGQLNASVATQDRRLTAIESVCSENSKLLAQQENTFQDKLALASTKLVEDTRQQLSALSTEYDRRTSQLELQANKNADSIMEQSEAISRAATNLQHEIAERCVVLSNKITENNTRTNELQVISETNAVQTQNNLAQQQTDMQALLSTCEKQLNQSAACQNQQYDELQTALQGQEARLEEQSKLTLDVDASVSQLNQSVDQLSTNWREEDCFHKVSSLQQSLAVESDKLVAINQVVGEDRQRLVDLEASLNTSIAARQSDLKSSAEQIGGIDSVLTEILDTELPELRRQIDEIISTNSLMLGKNDPRISELETSVNNNATDIADSLTKNRQLNNEVARLFTELKGLVEVQTARVDAVDGALSDRVVSVISSPLETLRADVKEALEGQIEVRLSAAEDGVGKIERLRATVGQSLEMLARVRAEWQQSAARLQNLESRVATRITND